MCRGLLYLGQPIAIDELLHHPDNSLIKQTYRPKLMTTIQNLAGFGMVVWSRDSRNQSKPLLYKTSELPFFDKNLTSLASKTDADCLLAHVRGVAYSDKEIVVRENAHPFLFEGARIAFAHNGVLSKIHLMKRDLVQLIHPDFLKQIHGTTDSEWIYALFLSQFKSLKIEPTVDQIKRAVLKTLAILADLRRAHKIKIASPINLFISSGSGLVATRFVFDYGHFPPEKSEAHFIYHSLWYTYGSDYQDCHGQYKMASGNRKSVIIASEPLTEDRTTWIEVPEYSLITAERNLNTHDVTINSYNIDV